MPGVTLVRTWLLACGAIFLWLLARNIGGQFTSLGVVIILDSNPGAAVYASTEMPIWRPIFRKNRI